MIVVVAILGLVLGAVFGAVQVLTSSARVNTENGSAANDLSHTMGLLSKTLMNARVLYADDYRIVVLNRLGDGTFNVESIYATAPTDPSSPRGRLVWERWSSDASGTVPVGAVHTLWEMSDRNANLSATPAIPLFAYYRAATDASILSADAGDKAIAPDSSVAAFVGTVPGGYTVSAIGRIRLHIAAALDSGIRDDSRDTVLRARN